MHVCIVCTCQCVRKEDKEREKIVWVLSVCVCEWKSVQGKHKKVMLRNGCREEERV